MLSKKNVTISVIKKDEGQKGTYYKVYFKELLFKENQEKVFFAFKSDSETGELLQAFQMFDEKVFKEGDKVNIEWSERNNYNHLSSVSRFVEDSSVAVGRGSSRANLNGEWVG